MQYYIDYIQEARGHILLHLPPHYPSFNSTESIGAVLMEWAASEKFSWEIQHLYIRL